MHWIAIHENVLGSKLRGLRKRLNCSEAEALGILTILWLWARKNADSTGLLANTDKQDINDAIRASINENLKPSQVTEAMIDEGWIDDVEGTLYIHDWEEWQSQWYTYLERKKKDAERKRRERARQKQEAEEQQEKAEEVVPQPEEEKQKEPVKKKVEKPPKSKYADNVSMHPEEYQKLVDKYGEEFTQKCIEKLDLYKGSKGKTYKDDYRAILSWVIEDIEAKYPNLKRRSTPVAQARTDNPFALYK